MKKDLSEIIKNLPGQPGIYRFYNEAGEIIYIGKAINLKKRVSSYFIKGRHENGKTKMLVSRIADISYMIVDSETDAFLLENNLIKKHKPKYNVLLKDDKTYPWICIKNENYPRIFSTRNVVKDGSFYFGPYASVRMMNTMLELIRQLFPLRNCNLNLSDENILKKKFKVCLEYHLGNCKAPCTGLQTKADYDQSIAQIKEILKGNAHVVVMKLKEMMEESSRAYKFEQAQYIKEKIDILENFRSKSVIVNPSINNVDVFSIVTEGDHAFANYIKVMNGSIIQAHTLELKKNLDEKPEELLSIVIMELRERYNSTA